MASGPIFARHFLVDTDCRSTAPEGVAMKTTSSSRRPFAAERIAYYQAEAARCRALAADTPFSNVKDDYLDLAVRWEAMLFKASSDAEAEHLAERIVGRASSENTKPALRLVE